MSEIFLQKMGNGLFPAYESDAEKLEKYPHDVFLRAEVSRPRNYKFHRKFYALLNAGYAAWEPPENEYKGLPAQKQFERFRKDCVIAAGYYDVVTNIKGDVRLEAKSISFAEMDDTEFAALYNAVINVLLQRVLNNYTREDLDQVVERLIGFA